MELNQINEVDETTARNSLQNCCGSSKWVDSMMEAIPFISPESLFQTASQIWWQLSPSDWLEAFTHHPKIGDLESLSKKFQSTATWAAGEQASVATAVEEVIKELAEGNNSYERKFGYIFIVCATGKTAEEMLQILKARFPNKPDIELKLAAAEQEKITRLRLEKLCQ